jgi:hypothetical protein
LELEYLATVGNMPNDSLLNGSLDDMTHVSMVNETAMAKQRCGSGEMDVTEKRQFTTGDDEQ